MKMKNVPFPSHILKKLQPYSIHKDADLTSLMVSQKLSMRYLEIMPQPIIASEQELPFHYCWWIAILSRNRIDESVSLL